MTENENKNNLFMIQETREFRPKLQFIDEYLNRKETIEVKKDSISQSKINFKNNNTITEKQVICKKKEDDHNINNYFNLNDKNLDTKNIKFVKESILSNEDFTLRTKKDKSMKNEEVISCNNKIKEILNKFNDSPENRSSKDKQFNKKDNFLMNCFINQNLLKYDTKKEDYENILIEHIIMNRNIHIVAVLKDYMIYDYKDEFLKRYYTTQESHVRLPIFANYYQNYLKFFCIPVFREINLNKIAQNHGDNKAELYYVHNYGRRDLTENNINNMNINFDDNCSVDYENIKLRNILTTTIRENIEETVITKNDIAEENSIFSGSILDFRMNEKGIGFYVNQIQNNWKNKDSMNGDEIDKDEKLQDKNNKKNKKEKEEELNNNEKKYKDYSEKFEETQTINCEEAFSNCEFENSKSNINESINFFLDNSMVSGIISKRSKEESIINILSNMQNNKVTNFINRPNIEKPQDSKEELVNALHKNMKFIIKDKDHMVNRKIDTNACMDTRKNGKISDNQFNNNNNNNSKNSKNILRSSLDKKSLNEKNDDKKIRNTNEKILNLKNALFKSHEDIYSRNKKPLNNLNSKNTDSNTIAKKFNTNINENTHVKSKDIYHSEANFKSQLSAITSKMMYNNNKNKEYIDKNILNKKDLKSNLNNNKSKNIKNRSYQNLLYSNKILKNNYINNRNEKFNNNLFNIVLGNANDRNKDNKTVNSEKNNLIKSHYKNQKITTSNNKSIKEIHKSSNKTDNISHNNFRIKDNNESLIFDKSYKILHNSKEKIITNTSLPPTHKENIMNCNNSDQFNLESDFNKSNNKSQFNNNLNSILEETIESKYIYENNENSLRENIIGNSKGNCKLDKDKFPMKNFSTLNSKQKNYSSSLGIIKMETNHNIKTEENKHSNKLEKGKNYSFNSLSQDPSSLKNDLDLYNKPIQKINQSKGFVSNKQNIFQKENQSIESKLGFNESNNEALFKNFYNDLGRQIERTRNKDLQNNFLTAKENSLMKNDLNTITNKSINNNNNNKQVNSLTYSSNSPFKILQNLNYKSFGDLNKIFKTKATSEASKKGIYLYNKGTETKNNVKYINLKKSNGNLKVSQPSLIINGNNEVKNEKDNLKNFTNNDIGISNEKNQHQMNPNLLVTFNNQREKNNKSSSYSKSNVNLILKNNLNIVESIEKVKNNSVNNFKNKHIRNNTSETGKIIDNKLQPKKNLINKNFQFEQHEIIRANNDYLDKNNKSNDLTKLGLCKNNINSLSYKQIDEKSNLKSENNSNSNNSYINTHNYSNCNNLNNQFKKNPKTKSQIINLNLNLNFNNLNLNLQRTQSNKSSENNSHFKEADIPNTTNKSKFSKEKVKEHSIYQGKDNNNFNSPLLQNLFNNKNIKSDNKNKDLNCNNMNMLSDLLKISIPDKNSRNKQKISNIISSSLSKLTGPSNLFNTQNKEKESLTNNRIGDLNYNLTNKTNCKSIYNLQINNNNIALDTNKTNTINTNLKINFKSLNKNFNKSLKQNQVPISLRKNSLKDLPIMDHQQVEKGKKNLLNEKKLEKNQNLQRENKQSNSVNFRADNKHELSYYSGKIVELDDFKHDNSFNDITCSKEISFTDFNATLKNLKIKEKNYSDNSENKKNKNYTNSHLDMNSNNNDHFFIKENKNSDMRDKIFNYNKIYTSKEINHSPNLNSQNFINELGRNKSEENQHKNNSKLRITKKSKDIYNDSLKKEKKINSLSKEKFKNQNDLKLKNRDIKLNENLAKFDKSIYHLTSHVNSGNLSSNKNSFIKYTNNEEMLLLNNYFSKNQKDFINSKTNNSPDNILIRNNHSNIKNNNYFKLNNNELESNFNTKNEPNKTQNSNVNKIGSVFSKSTNDLGLLNSLLKNPLLLNKKKDKENKHNSKNLNLKYSAIKEIKESSKEKVNKVITICNEETPNDVSYINNKNEKKSLNIINCDTLINIPVNSKNKQAIKNPSISSNNPRNDSKIIFAKDHLKLASDYLKKPNSYNLLNKFDDRINNIYDKNNHHQNRDLYSKTGRITEENRIFSPDGNKLTTDKSETYEVNQLISSGDTKMIDYAQRIKKSCELAYDKCSIQNGYNIFNDLESRSQEYEKEEKIVFIEQTEKIKNYFKMDENADVYDREHNQLWNRNLEYLVFSDNLIENVKAKQVYDLIDNKIKLIDNANKKEIKENNNKDKYFSKNIDKLDENFSKFKELFL